MPCFDIVTLYHSLTVVMIRMMRRMITSKDSSFWQFGFTNIFVCDEVRSTTNLFFLEMRLIKVMMMMMMMMVTLTITMMIEVMMIMTMPMKMAMVMMMTLVMTMAPSRSIYKLNFPGNLCRAAFAILTMFF